MTPGEIDLVSPRVGDIHIVANALSARPSVSINVYAIVSSPMAYLANVGTGVRLLQRYYNNYHDY